MKLTFLLIFNLFNIDLNEGKLSVQSGHLSYNGEKVFLSGVNFAWINYGRDFGSGAYSQVKSRFESAIDEIANSGGNAMRVWLHIDGQWSPKFDSNGFATGADTASLIKELGELLDHAASKNVFVILCLWNLAVKPEHMIHLYTEQNEAKLNSYLEKVLKPLAKGLANKPALAAYDIINEPAGSFAQAIQDSNPCFDTMILKGSGTDWTHSHLKINDVLRFINQHASAIKSVDPKALITVGDGADTCSSVCDNCRNYYSDHCLQTAGGKANGHLDFYQFHSYTWQGKFPDTSPFKKHNSDYKSDKPIVVGEFSIVCSEMKDPDRDYKYLYESGYSGAMNWMYLADQGDCTDKRGPTDSGMAAIKDMTSNGKIRIKF